MKRHCVETTSLLLAAFLASLLAGCSENERGAPTIMPEGERVQVRLDADLEDGRLDERYLGLTFDTAHLQHRIDGSDIEGGGEPPDLEDERLRSLAAAVGPSILRIGGTDADGVYYCDTEEPCEVPQEYLDAFRPDRRAHASYFTRKDIRRFADFAEAIDAQILFCLNFGPGPRDPETGAWLDDNARQLVRYARSLPNGNRFTIWEAGNEPGIQFAFFNTAANFGPEVYASDLPTLQSLVAEQSSGALVAAPASYFFPEEDLADFGFTEAVVDLAGGAIDVVTWHFYPTQSESCGGIVFPSGADNLFDEEILEKSQRYARYVRDAAGGLPVFLAETSSSECGGQVGVSDTLLEALWYSDWIGLMARSGSSAIVRQTLMGFDYGIVDPDTYEARPTLLALAAFQRFVERARLATDVDRSRIKAHGFCHPEGPAWITAVLVNPGPNRLAAEIELADHEVRSASQWTIASLQGLGDDRATIEGESADETGRVPQPPGTPVHLAGGRAFAAVAPESLVFVSLELDSAARGCTN